MADKNVVWVVEITAPFDTHETDLFASESLAKKYALAVLNQWFLEELKYEKPFKDLQKAQDEMLNIPDSSYGIIVTLYRSRINTTQNWSVKVDHYVKKGLLNLGANKAKVRNSKNAR